MATSAETEAGRPEPVGEDYPLLIKLLAVVASFFFSLITLIVALVMLSSERNPLRRSFLKLWAGISAAAIIIPLVLLFGVASGGGTGGSNEKGPCVGGPAMGASGTPDANGYVTFPCAISGSTRVYMGGGGATSP